MNITDRVALFIEKSGISKNKFDEMIGTSNGYIGKQIAKSSSIGGDIIEKIVSTFPEINPIWFLTGKGEMLINENNSPDNILQEIQELSEEDKKCLYKIIDLFIRDSKNRSTDK